MYSEVGPLRVTRFETPKLPRSMLQILGKKYEVSPREYYSLLGHISRESCESENRVCADGTYNSVAVVESVVVLFSLFLQRQCYSKRASQQVRDDEMHRVRMRC